MLATQCSYCYGHLGFRFTSFPQRIHFLFMLGKFIIPVSIYGILFLLQVMLMNGYPKFHRRYFFFHYHLIIL